MSYGEWIEWNGGKCPLPKEALIQVKHRDGFNTTLPRSPTVYCWAHYGFSSDIIAYRIRESYDTKAVKVAPTPKRIPISAAKRFAEDYNLRQVIIIGLHGDDQHIITYGATEEDCRQAGLGGDNLKKIWGWPDATLSKYSKKEDL